MKTDIFNLIILDESGSMGHLRQQTISGCNETINTIRSAQEQFADAQNHYVSIFAFQSDSRISSRYLVKNEPVSKVKHITEKDYCPNGCTPLYDAVGSTVVDLRSVTKERELAIGSVTVITDGYENSSTHYSLEQIVALIDALKEQGWTFNFIGADIDVERVSASMHMDASLRYEKTDDGMREMYRRERQARMKRYSMNAQASYDSQVLQKSKLAAEEKKRLYEKYREQAERYFDEEEERK